MNDFAAARQKALDATPEGLSKDLLKEVFTELISWPSATPGKPGYIDRDMPGPGYATWQEVMLLYLFAKYSQAQRPLEIGCAAGWSTVHIALGLAPTVTLTCVDPFTETEGGLGGFRQASFMKFATHLRRARLASVVKIHFVPSPDILPAIVPIDGWDFAFVDGWHFDGQPLKDVRTLQPLLSDDATLIMHDFFYPNVVEACHWLTYHGWEMTRWDTPNQLVSFWREGHRPMWWYDLVADAEQLLGEHAL
jgi:predicted O-methyltransferase YrrM